MCSFEFRADSTLGLMNEVYNSLRADGIQFPSPQKPKKEFTQVKRNNHLKKRLCGGAYK
jgi:signal transducing adaptor molecule